MSHEAHVARLTLMRLMRNRRREREIPIGRLARICRCPVREYVGMEQGHVAPWPGSDRRWNIVEHQLGLTGKLRPLARKARKL